VTEFKLFFATDIHGSDVCWKKFVNAARFFDCQVLVMGGDMTGKMLVPIVAIGGDRFRARIAGDERIVRGEDVARLRKLVADSG
jgi:Icc-related predicted phosphoesterase